MENRFLKNHILSDTLYKISTVLDYKENWNTEFKISKSSS